MKARHRKILTFFLRKFTDYYPFGMLVPNRNFQSPAYRYGFQGQEKDDEVKGNGNSLNYKFRMHDPRVGRFFATDPLERNYPYYTPYSFSGNKVIAFRELEGLEQKYYTLYLEDGEPELKLVRSKDTPWFTTDGNHIVIPELGISYSFNKQPWYATEGQFNNSYEKFSEFVEDPIGSILSGEFKSNESILSDAAEDIIIYLVLRKMGKLSKRTNKKGLGAIKKEMPAWLKRIRKGIKFQQKKLAKLDAAGVDYEGNIRLVPKNGKGNVKGNRTNTDALIKNSDGTYSIREYKLTNKTKLTKGQNRSKEHVENGSQDFEVRSDIKKWNLEKGDVIKVKDYKVEYEEIK